MIEKYLESALNAILIKDEYTYHHSLRVWSLSLELLRIYDDLTENDICRDYEHIMSAAALTHDLGKLYWKDSILKGTATLDDKQIRIERNKHPEVGAGTMFEALKEHADEDDLLFVMIILFHHWDYEDTKGRYPLRIENEELEKYIKDRVSSLYPKHKKSAEADSDPVRIMIGILRLADSFDAAVNPRPYKTFKPGETYDERFESFLREAAELSGTVFHPDVAGTFIEFFHAIKNDVILQSRLIYPTPDQEVFGH
jgi:HD-GYP domain-containing protein (c-di-GMP phosphodiesterase class II)